MRLKTSIERHRLHFKKPAGTSRGVYKVHDVWYVRIWFENNPERVGVGECAPLPDLSCDAGPDYEQRLQLACSTLENADGVNTTGIDFLDASFWGAAGSKLFNLQDLRAQPSILFGFETALRQLQSGSTVLWDSAFTRGESGIPINGLIWMGSFSNMQTQIQDKLNAGYSCLKLKIGAIDFESEYRLLQDIRASFSAERLVLRVDANGAFSLQEAREKLHELSKLDLHSIEQPIRAGERDALKDLIQTSSLPIALDEELIGIHAFNEKKILLETLKPAYIVLKPTLHGGISGCIEWIELANDLAIGWWITSALESNVGLSAIAQWTATLNPSLHQGLGTGLLYTNNLPTPLVIEGDKLWFFQSPYVPSCLPKH